MTMKEKRKNRKKKSSSRSKKKKKKIPGAAIRATRILYKQEKKSISLEDDQKNESFFFED